MKLHAGKIMEAVMVGAAKGLIVIFAVFPRTWILAWGRGTGRLMFRLLGMRAQVALDNLKLVYGDTLTPERRLTLARANFAHLGEVIFEIVHTVGRPGRLRKFLRIEGEEHLRQAVLAGKGAVMFSAHLGNFILMGGLHSPEFRIKYLMRVPGDRKAANLYLWAIKRLGIQTIPDNPREQSGYLCFKHLKKQGVLGILIDQVETGGIYVDFLGNPAGSSLGAVSLALRSGAPLLALRCVRLPDKTLRVSIGPELAIRRNGELNELVKEAVAETNRIVGEWVREYPEQWFWAHRRWRAWRK